MEFSALLPRKNLRLGFVLEIFRDSCRAYSLSNDIALIYRLVKNFLVCNEGTVNNVELNPIEINALLRLFPLAFLESF